MEDYRNVMAQLVTGVTIITVESEDTLHGMTANAVTSLSLEPRLVLICVDKRADSHDLIVRAKKFAINILSREQSHLSDQFAKKDGLSSHSIDAVPHFLSAFGNPILSECLAYLDCRVANEYAGGDHTILIGEVREAQILNNEAPLIFHRGRYLQCGDA